jgi:carbonic anhydrase
VKTINNLLQQNKEWAAAMTEADANFFEKLRQMQAPEFLWIGCSDSRITPVTSLGILPGEMFVHRNVANLVIYSDMNCLSVMQFAIEILKVKHLIVCGHYNCGGVKAALEDARYGLIDNWLRHLQDIAEKHRPLLDSLETREAQLDKLCEINVIEQVVNAGETTFVREAWERGQKLMIHGWIYTIADGIYRDLKVTIDGAEKLSALRSNTSNVAANIGNNV